MKTNPSTYPTPTPFTVTLTVSLTLVSHHLQPSPMCHCHLHYIRCHCQQLMFVPPLLLQRRPDREKDEQPQEPRRPHCWFYNSLPPWFAQLTTTTVIATCCIDLHLLHHCDGYWWWMLAFVQSVRFRWMRLARKEWVLVVNGWVLARN